MTVLQYEYVATIFILRVFASGGWRDLRLYFERSWPVERNVRWQYYTTST